MTEPAPALDIESLHSLAARIMAGESVADGTALAILITTDEAVRTLNRRFRGIDMPTDVLSFPDEADDFVQGAADEPMLGDIAIAIETAARQASERQQTLDAEVRHLATHGVLHLCGYDHEAGPEDEARMRTREEFYLGDLGAFHEH